MKSTSRPTKYWSFRRRVVYLVASVIVPRAIHLLFDLNVINKENALKCPEGEPVVYCANHRSHLDAPIAASAILRPYGSRKFLSLMASGKAMKENFLFGLTSFLGAFPVHRDNPNLGLNYAIKSLKEGLAFFLFPQGKRIHNTPFYDYFNLAEQGKTGIGRIVLLTNGKIPVVPLYMHGTAETLKRGKLLPKFGAYISINFAEPLLFDQYSRPEGWSEDDPQFYEVARDIANTIMHKIHLKLIESEKHYLHFLEWKFDTRIENIKISTNKEKSFNKFLRKLGDIHPKTLEEFLKSRSC